MRDTFTWLSDFLQDTQTTQTTFSLGQTWYPVSRGMAMKVLCLLSLLSLVMGEPNYHLLKLQEAQKSLAFMGNRKHQIVPSTYVRNDEKRPVNPPFKSVEEVEEIYNVDRVIQHPPWPKKVRTRDGL